MKKSFQNNLLHIGIIILIIIGGCILPYGLITQGLVLNGLSIGFSTFVACLGLYMLGPVLIWGNKGVI